MKSVNINNIILLFYDIFLIETVNLIIIFPNLLKDIIFYRF